MSQKSTQEDKSHLETLSGTDLSAGEEFYRQKEMGKPAGSTQPSPRYFGKSTEEEGKRPQALIQVSCKVPELGRHQEPLWHSHSQ